MHVKGQSGITMARTHLEVVDGGLFWVIFSFIRIYLYSKWILVINALLWTSFLIGKLKHCVHFWAAEDCQQELVISLKGGSHVHLAVPKWHECTSHNPDFHFFNLLSPLLQPLTQQCLPGMFKLNSEVFKVTWKQTCTQNK